MRSIAAWIAISLALCSVAAGGYTPITAPDPNDPNENSCSHENIFDSNIPTLPGDWALSGVRDYAVTGGLLAVRVDDDNDKTWSDGRYTIIARGGCSNKTQVSLGYIDPNGSTFVPLCSGSKSDLQCEVNFPGEGFKWAIKVDQTVLASDDVSDSMVTYNVYEPNSVEPTTGPNRHWMVFWEEGADADFNDAVFEIWKIAPMLRTGSDATMVGISHLKFPHYLRIKDPNGVIPKGVYESARGAFFASRFDAIYLASAVPWENEVIHYRWNKNREYDPNMYNAILNADSRPELLEHMSIRYVRVLPKTPDVLPVHLNTFVDPGLTSIFGSYSLYGHAPDPNDPNYPAQDPNRASWLLTKDGSEPNEPNAVWGQWMRVGERFALDWVNEACRDWVVENAIDRLVGGIGGHEYTGYGADNVAIGPHAALEYSSRSGWNWKYKGKEYKWEQAGIAFLKELRDGLHAYGRYLSPNTDLQYHNDLRYLYDRDPNDSQVIAGEQWAWDQLLYGDNGRPIIDMAATEIPLKLKKSEYQRHLLGSDWERAMQRHEEVINAGVVDWWYIYPVHMDLSWRGRSFLYNYASFLLIAQPGRSLFYSTLAAQNVSNQTVMPWYDWYDFDLGEARGARITDPNQGFCYRFYDNAVVVVNPTTSTITIDPNNPSEYLTDTSVNPSVVYRPFSLSSGRGLILPRYDATLVDPDPVDPNDPNNQQAWSGANAIQTAIDQASDGDTIFIAPGVYQEQLKIGGKNIVLRSIAPEDPNIVASTIINPLNPANPNDPNYYGPALKFRGTESAYDMRTREGCRVMGLSLITKDPNSATDPNSAAVVGRGSLASLERCRVQNLGGDGISNLDGLIAYCNVSNNSGNGIASCDGSILFCTINNNGGAGILNGSVDGYVHNCYIQNNDRGINNHDGLISNCLITGNHTDTVGAGLYGCDGIIASCTIADNTANDSASAMNPSAGLYNNQAEKIVHCIIWGNYIGSTIADLNAFDSIPTYSCFDPNSILATVRSYYTHPSNNNIFTDPQLNAFYRISTTSDCVDAGSTDPNDIYGIEHDKFLYDTLDGNYDSYNPRYGTTHTFGEPARLASRMADLGFNLRVKDKGGDNSVYEEVSGPLDMIMTDRIDIGAFEQYGNGSDLEYEGDGDCDGDGLVDFYEPDLDNNGIPDDCDPNLVDCNGNGIPDALDLDLDNNGLVDSCEIAANPNLDLNQNSIIDTYETVLYVDASVMGGRGDGSSWVHAFGDLQNALAYASTHLYVNEIWVAAGTYTADPNTAFEPVSNVDLYGGFSGNEFNRSERDHENNVTILSGLGSNYPVIRLFNKHSVIIDGFTIQDGDYIRKGGGVEIGVGSTNITIANCAIKNNQSELQAGGVYVTGASSGIILEDCILSGNSPASGAATTYGGAFGIATSSSAEIKRCIITNNSAYVGGAIRVSSTSSLVCSDSLISWNTANITGAIHADGQVDLINCTLSKNHASIGHRAISQFGGHIDVINSIIYGNTGGASVAINLTGGATATVTYSDIEGGWTGTGNINSDPYFRDPDGADNQGGTSDDNFTLATHPWSPCIDAGDNTAISGTKDLAGNPRLDDDLAIVDMGAYERQP